MPINYKSPDAKLVSSPDNNNWDIYYSPSSKRFSAIAKPHTGAKDSAFGGISHVKRLVRHGYFKDALEGLAEYGMELLKEHKVIDENGEVFDPLKARISDPIILST